VELLGDRPGPVLELGLGNGRTFDHLREKLGSARIFVFERDPKPHPACWPDPGHLIVGPIERTLEAAHARFEGRAVLVHADLGTGDPERNARLARWLAAVLPALLAEGAIVASDQKLESPALEPLPPPAGVDPERYFLYRHVRRAGPTVRDRG
jgi:hypothetical protein